MVNPKEMGADLTESAGQRRTSRGGGPTWIAFMVKDRYSLDIEKYRIKVSLMRQFNLPDAHVKYVSGCNRGEAVRYYLFVKERDPENDLRDMYVSQWEKFTNYRDNVRLSEEEMVRMTGMSRIGGGEVGYGDIVKVTRGWLSNLYGIVIGPGGGESVTVGFRMNERSMAEDVRLIDLELCGNIFNFLKVP